MKKQTLFTALAVSAAFGLSACGASHSESSTATRPVGPNLKTKQNLTERKDPDAIPSAQQVDANGEPLPPANPASQPTPLPSATPKSTPKPTPTPMAAPATTPKPKASPKPAPARVQPSSDEGANAALPDFKSREVTTDLKNVQAAEAALQAVGFKFSLENDARGHRSVIWDWNFLDTYNGNVFGSEQALANFELVARNFRDRYGKSFTVNGKTDVFEKISSTTIPVLQAKITLVDETLSRIQKMKQTNQR